MKEQHVSNEINIENAEKKGVSEYKRYVKKYNKRVKMLYTFSVFLAVFISVLVYMLCENIYATCATLCLGIMEIGLIYFMNKADDTFMSEIVASLSEVLDILIELEAREVFPANEDTIVSKLQNQIVKLTRNLKKQNERETKEHENIKGLVSDLSHQLKVPMSNLRMYLDFLKNPNISEEERKEYISILEMTINRLNFLSESMIKVSRLESGLVHINQENKSINETILKAIKNAYAYAKQKGIVIKYEEEFKGEVCHDTNWTAEAIFNLLDNAIKYGDEGGVVVLSVRSLGTLVEISVQDSNDRILDEEANKIFGRFYRGKNSGIKDGVGIGLYLTREIITRQGGTVTLKSSDEGNRFSILLKEGDVA